ncbi:Frag1/DRAM/Sfk1 family-domain-containing protein [Myxozyma melibiosi]|uniref:Frag1/DRAM/Sfk1 family-domain-containing protein n=1 Tax=Myxozyma melibiosi TaxID=54550 RepID=A0ABR1F5W9_9ASCO
MSAVAEKRAKPGTVIASVSGKWVSYAHTVFAGYAFISALVVGMALHFEKIVRNEYYGFPDEWFPSVSAAIGDRYPERSIFQLFIAVTAGPRFALVFLTYLLYNKPGSWGPRAHVAVGLLRTLTCGGWVYITSTDDHDWHDIFMIAYMLLTLPWTVGGILLSRPGSKALKYRKIFGISFFVMIVPLVYYFIQHKVNHVAGAYTIYAFFEWSLIFFDVAFDAATAFDFGALEIRVVDMNGITNGAVPSSSSSSSRGVELRVKDTGLLTGFSFGTLFTFAVDVYNSFVFWSVLTSLGLLIWYFPLWYMGISGYEVTLLSTISPFLLGLPFLTPLFARFPQLSQLGTVVGIAAYLVPGPSDRLLTVSAACMFASISLAMQFHNVTARPFLSLTKATAFSIGFIGSVLAKFAFYANNPIWPIMHDANGGWNKSGLVVGVVAALLTTRPQRGSSEAVSASKRGSFIFASCGLAGLLFSMHSLLSDSSTMIYWVWDGYPLTGPLPVPYGAVTILAMVVGAYVGVTGKSSTLASWPAFAVGSAGAFVLYKFDGWFGYFGGLVLATYLIAIVPVLFESASIHPAGRTFGVGFLLYDLIVLGHVWVVAYAFVPGGPLLRERTDILVTVSMAMIGLGVYGAKKAQAVTSSSTGVFAPGKKTKSVSFFKVRAMAAIFLTAISVLTVVVAWRRTDKPAPQPYHPEEKLMTVGIWTIHFGLDNDMWASEVRMRDAIAELELDVVGLLESDTQRIIMGNRDVTQQIAEDLGMYVDFGPGPNRHTWGAALLSKFPIVKSTHHLLPSPVGELAPAIHATLDVYGEMIDVVVFHSGQEEDVEDRRLQTAGVSEIMAKSENPTILLSYLVTKPLEGNYNTYVSEYTGMSDIDPSDWDRWCEYILYKKIKRVAYARVSRGTITDTEIQTGKFVVGVEPASTNERVPEEQVAEGLRYPAVFRGDGVRGHRYHVFDEPRYYA